MPVNDAIARPARSSPMISGEWIGFLPASHRQAWLFQHRSRRPVVASGHYDLSDIALPVGWLALQADRMTIDRLPAGYVLRRPTDTDAEAILKVVEASDTRVLGYVDFTLDDVRDELDAPFTDLGRDHWVVTDAPGRIVAWAYVSSRYGNDVADVEAYVDPEAPVSLQAGLLGLLLRRCGERAAETGDPAHTAHAWVVAGDAEWAAALHDAGFRVDRRFNRMQIDLTPDWPVPAGPGGVTLHGFDPESDADWADWHDTLTESFSGQADFTPRTLDAFRAGVSAEANPGYSDWRFAELDGLPVAICQCPASDLAAGGGLVRNLGVRPQYRGRGIARYLLQDAFHRFATKGMTYCRLGVDTANPNDALSLYESAGMRVLFSADRYARICAAVPPA
jgi:mycothiol synthase